MEFGPYRVPIFASPPRGTGGTPKYLLCSVLSSHIAVSMAWPAGSYVRALGFGAFCWYTGSSTSVFPPRVRRSLRATAAPASDRAGSVDRAYAVPALIHWRASLVPAAVVIPAPIAYISVVAVKKLVVRFWVGSAGPPQVCTGRLVPSAGDVLPVLIGRVVPPVLRTTAKAFAKDVFINQERKLGARRRSDTVLVSTTNDADQGSGDVTFRTPLAPYEKSKFLGFGGSMVEAET
ncbi:hypothetical protein TEA_029618 [Camellia sinensis var. sinensis]|uniref:Uncharacterized protein n=1 Tax=Camellia sinensis var. sinensis TaxID=542762 RepID=A0A4S4DP17_CAMSN|nr:hypothetical protein TEA_029618 [Camellia sinensis var. sinensis]